ASLRAKSKDPQLVVSSAWVADPSQAQDDTHVCRPETYETLYLATDQKAVRTRGPGRVVLGSKPQLATAKELVRWAGDSTQARSLRLQKNSCAGFGESQA